ncbi:uncharacterized protein LOC119080042 [Bradysia coprophila]|uniref:uncharacterized protein LOC119080042 n=1 Tax=Bradysia coprophila TaxID=38358 RepID=UPI00187DA842|nr:uncharacterized protein LOC119080042 [Bradysia coprophila]
MGRTTRKRSLSSGNKEKTDTSDSSSTSDSEIGDNKAGDRKRLKKSDDKEWNGSESSGSEQSAASNQSKAKKATKPTKPTKDSTTTDNKKPNKFIKKNHGWGKALEVESIITHGVSANEKKSRKYKVKLKDESMIWVSGQMLTAICPELVRQYKEDINSGKFVEAIVSHEKQKNRSIKYLIRWADKSKGETWETKESSLKFCPNLLKPYMEKMEEKEAEAIAVTAILAHKLVDHKSQYLIKWNDKSKGETWETARRTIALCPNILDKFTMKNPDCVPNLYIKESVDKPGMSKRKSQLKNRNRYYKVQDPNLLDFDEDFDWEVERIMEMSVKRDKTREFLVRWKGFRSAYDSWLPESDLNCPDLLEKFMNIKENRDEKRALLQYKNGKLRTVKKRRGKPRDKPKIRLTATTSKVKPKARRSTTSKKSSSIKRLPQKRKENQQKRKTSSKKK